MHSVDITIDSIVSKTGDLKILEFMDSKLAGFKGFSDVYGKDMHRHLEKHRMRTGASPIDGLSFLKAAWTNKAILASFVAPACPELFPQQQAIAYVRGRNINDNIPDFLCSTTGQPSVIKVPVAARGEGVFFFDANKKIMHGLSAEEQEALFGNFLVEATDVSQKNPNGAPWQGHVVAQEFIAPRPIRWRNNFWSPTIRTSLSIAWKAGKEGSPDIKLHGSYYKLPSQPVQDAFDARSFKSFINGGKGAAPIQAPDVKAIVKTVPEALRQIFCFCVESDAESLVLEALKGESSGDAISALALADLLNSEACFSDSFRQEYNALSDELSKKLPIQHKIGPRVIDSSGIVMLLIPLAHMTPEKRWSNLAASFGSDSAYRQSLHESVRRQIKVCFVTRDSSDDGSCEPHCW